MTDASWALSAFLTVGFLVAAFVTDGALSIGWFLLGLGMAVVTVVRFNAARGPRGDGDRPDRGDRPGTP